MDANEEEQVVDESREWKEVSRAWMRVENGRDKSVDGSREWNRAERGWE